MQGMVKLLLIALFLCNLVHSQTLPEEAKEKLLSRINEDTYDSVIDSIREFNVVEAIPLLERYIFLQNDDFKRKCFLELLYELNSPNIIAIAKSYLDSARIGRVRTTKFSDNLSGSMAAFKILFKINDFSYIDDYFGYLNRMPQKGALYYYFPSLIELAKKEEYKERVKPYFEKIIKSGFNPLKIGPYLEKYQEIYNDTNLALAKYVVRNDTSVIVRRYIIGRIMRKIKAPHIVEFYKERLDYETDFLAKAWMIWGILDDFPTPSNYLYIKNKFDTFNERVKIILRNGGYNKMPHPDSSETPQSMIDSLISYNNQCYELGWLSYEWVWNINKTQLENARLMLNTGYPSSTAIILQAYENWVNTAKGYGWINEDAYRFLYYYSVYLRERLKV
ncbi:hypothetical protein MROS_2383 [Melioribacter roseus P3M-2]|uniref:Uncharacterized protein n=1 Tax=Melioribacter roseus (strain DSM 23840 / JCM 17771 / VKM B-2668 / P3M-2) TaxID=1191523 RepID=I7A325_MELRP|nr:hypothetical protein [Melioribacter roseus]AFN75613.1 hypothetical protein MROS_2383 [Melioribacter roseus P3M-2]